MGTPVAIRQSLKQIELSKLHDDSVFDEVLGYVLFEHAGEIDWCADDLTEGFPYDWDTTSFHSVSVYNCEPSKREHSWAWHVVQEYDVFEALSLDQEKVTSFGDRRRAIEIWIARKNGCGSNVTGNESELIPSKFSSRLAAIADAQTRLGGQMSAKFTNLLNLALRWSESAANRLAEPERGKESAIDHVSKVRSELVK